MAGPTDNRWSRVAALRPARNRTEVSPSSARAPDESDDLAQRLGAVVGRNRYGEHLAIRKWFSTPEACEPTARTVRLLLPNPQARDADHQEKRLADASQWLFLDTETTGLAGGTGTYAFLVGLAWWEAGGLHVEQYFMRDHGEEHSLLEELAARVAERPVVVTFNGKSFDWPLLETRFAMTRAIAAPRPALHLDLLHPARAVWKLRLGSVRLKELEQRALDAPRLGWHRGDDVDSAMIPQLYFDYLRGGPAEPLAGVVRHNQMDLRGLAALAGKLVSLLGEAQTPAETSEEALDLYGLSRLLDRRGESRRARTTCERALEAGLPVEANRAARRDLALLAKRQGDFERAEALWREMREDPRGGPFACEQLAIYYEHRIGDARRAMEIVREALAQLRRARRSRRSPLAPARMARLEEQFRRRLVRLERRIEGRGKTPHLLQTKRLSDVSREGSGESNPA